MNFKQACEAIEQGKIVDIVATNKAKETLCIRLLNQYPKDCRVSTCLIKNVSYIGRDDILNDKFHPELLNVNRLVVKKIRQRVSL